MKQGGAKGNHAWVIFTYPTGLVVHSECAGRSTKDGTER